MLFHLPITLVQIKGTDAEKFLQGQMTCDVSRLPIGSHTLTAHCDATGKVQSLFRLYRADTAEFYAFIPQPQLAHSLQHLKKYAIFSQVTFTPIAEQILGEIVDKTDNSRPDFRDNFSLSLADGRKIYALPLPLPNITFAPYTLWQQAEIQAGIPQLSLEHLGKFIPQALNLQHIEQTLSFTKGCYIGQETIARAKYRGTNKRAMHVFYAQTQTTSHINENELAIQLGENWRKTGSVLCQVQTDGELWLEVVLNGEVEPESHYRLGDIRLTHHSLTYPEQKETK